jgi:hypothetical protein
MLRMGSSEAFCGRSREALYSGIFFGLLGYGRVGNECLMANAKRQMDGLCCMGVPKKRNIMVLGEASHNSHNLSHSKLPASGWSL